jgi:hypothetical protein
MATTFTASIDWDIDNHTAGDLVTAYTREVRHQGGMLDEMAAWLTSAH